MSLNDCTPENVQLNEEQWQKYFENDDLWNSAPSLNVHEVHNLKNLTLVRFRGMVQDMHSPEYYLEKFEIVNKLSNEKSVKHGKYQDLVVGGENEEIEYDSPGSATGERQTFVVISTPAVNKWVEILENEQLKVKDVPSEVHRNKRPLNDEENNVETMEMDEPVKKLCTKDGGNSSQQPSVSTEHILNFPIADRPGKKCHVQVYNGNDALKLNDTIEFLGFLSVNPLFGMDRSGSNDNEDNRMEIETHYPPSSIVPRIHCLSFRKIEHHNPLVTKNYTMEREHMQFLKKELSVVLTQLLLGDDLATEYLICHLISEIYIRRDGMALGKFTLNISNIPKIDHIDDYTKTLYEFIEMLIPKSHYFPMTLENMNDQSFIPKKDYECNRLTSGILQLSSNTHLVLDETKLSDGKLNSAGVNNLKALASSIKHQRLAYDFNYYPIEYDCDIPFLILSEGKSMLTPDCHVILQPEESCVNTFEEIIQAAKHFLKPELLKEIRSYLTLARRTTFEITDKMEELVQEEFVNMRQRESAVSADDLHNLLVLARLLCLSEGKNSLDEGCWRKACDMEQKRKSRIPLKK